MRISHRWLSEFIEVGDIEADRLGDLMSSLGHEVESIERLERPFENVVVGRVTAVGSHPDADRIRLCRVSDGADEVDVVCGAFNFEADAMIAFARPGAVLPGGFEIGTRTIRGVVSNGMICSESELGLGQEADGIWVLPDTAEIGADLAEALGYPDVIFDVAITPNRPDAMSVHGIARDLAAKLELPIVSPETRRVAAGQPSSVRIKIADARGAPRYVGQEVSEVKAGPSPLWMQARLSSAGLRPISNIVDITNYVMLELGQPLHAFDLDRVTDGTIEVRRARAGESLETLDGVTRELSTDDLMITDGGGVVALAGLMGGGESEVSGETTRVLIEAANFDAPTVMEASRRHGFRTEASARFERGVDPELPPVAAARATHLMEELAGGTAAAEAIDVYPEVIEPVSVELGSKLLRRILGDEVSIDLAAKLLVRLGMGVSGDDPLTVSVPTFRPDISRPIDLIEEVARLHGLDKFEELGARVGPSGGLTHEQRRLRRLRSLLAGAGLSEAYNLSFVGLDALSLLGLDPADDRMDPVRVTNPLREDQGALRTTLLPGLLASASFNVNRGASGVSLFEIGTVFFRRPSPLDPAIPDQPAHLGFIGVGGVGLSNLGSRERPSDGFSAVGIVELLSRELGIEGVNFTQVDEAPFHPGRAVAVTVAGVRIGIVGELHPAAARASELSGRVVAGELQLAPLVEVVTPWAFVEPSPFPPEIFDLSFDLPVGVASSDLRDTVRSAAGDLLESADVFDEYTGDGVAVGRKSLAVRVALRAADRTLTGDEVAPLRAAIAASVVDELGGELRGEL